MQEQPERKRRTLFTVTPEYAAMREARIQAEMDRVQRELLDHPEQEREALRHQGES